jgi:hypothetical protein
MRFEIRTLSRVMSTLVVLFVLVFGAGMDVLAQRRGRDWGRSHNRGRHLGWERGRRVGQHRRSDGTLFRRTLRRNRRTERRALRRQRRIERRSFSGSDRSLLESQLRQQRAELRARQRSERALFRQSRGGHGRH